MVRLEPAISWGDFGYLRKSAPLHLGPRLIHHRLKSLLQHPNVFEKLPEFRGISFITKLLGKQMCICSVNKKTLPVARLSLRLGEQVKRAHVLTPEWNLHAPKLNAPQWLDKLAQRNEWLMCAMHTGHLQDTPDSSTGLLWADMGLKVSPAIMTTDIF